MFMYDMLTILMMVLVVVINLNSWSMAPLQLHVMLMAMALCDDFEVVLDVQDAAACNFDDLLTDSDGHLSLLWMYRPIGNCD